MRVGTRFEELSAKIDREDHPHACGDKIPPFNIIQHKVGSSPCVWGQDTFSVCLLSLTGIIPMRVGTSFDKAFNSAIE